MTVFGWTPVEVEPILSMGQDWEVTIEPAPGSTTPVWPADATVTAHVYSPSTDTSKPVSDWDELYAWPGTISSDRNTVSFKGAYAESDLVPAGSPMRIRVVFTNSSDNFTWAKGTVVRDD